MLSPTTGICVFMIFRFDDRVTGNLKHFARNAKIAHIDIDPAEIGKIMKTQIPVVGDSKIVLQELIKQDGKQSDSSEWKKQLAEWKFLRFKTFFFIIYIPERILFFPFGELFFPFA